MIIDIKIFDKASKSEGIVKVRIGCFSSKNDLVKYIFIPIVNYGIEYINDEHRSILESFNEFSKDLYVACTKCRFKLNVYDFCINELQYENPSIENTIVELLHHYVYKHILHNPKYVKTGLEDLGIFGNLALTSRHIILESIDEPETWLLVISRKVFEKNRNKIKRSIFEIESRLILEEIKKLSIRSVLVGTFGKYFMANYSKDCPKCRNPLFTYYYDEYDYERLHDHDFARKLSVRAYYIDFENKKIKVLSYVEKHFTEIDKDKAQCHHCNYIFSKSEIVNEILNKIYNQINDFVEKLYEIYVSLKK